MQCSLTLAYVSCFVYVSIKCVYLMICCSLHFDQLWISVVSLSLLHKEVSLMMDENYTHL